MQDVLIVRVCAIGDFVLNLPALIAFEKKHPKTRFTLVGNPSGLELATEFIAVRKIHSIELQPWARLFYEPVPELQFDSAIVWMKDDTVSENLRLSGIPNVLRTDPFPGYGHAADHLLRTLNLEMPCLPDLWVSESESVLIHPGSGSQRKNWPYFEELIDRVPAGVLLVGPSPSGRGRRDSLLEAGAPGEGCKFDEDLRPSPALRAASPRGRGVSTLQDLSLPEVFHHLRRCRAYIGNDSGITHLAAYIGCPTIALFAPTDPRVWGPIGRRVRIIWKSKLEDIAVDEILQILHATHT